jgi:hypothetical protein
VAPSLSALDSVSLVTSRPKFAAVSPQLSHTSISIRSLRTLNDNGSPLQRGHFMGCPLLFDRLAMFDPFLSGRYLHLRGNFYQQYTWAPKRALWQSNSCTHRYNTAHENEVRD